MQEKGLGDVKVSAERDMKLVRSTVDINVLPIASSLKYSSISTSTSSLSKGPSQGLGRKPTTLQSNAFLEPLNSASFVFSIKKKGSVWMKINKIMLYGKEEIQR